LLCPERIIVTIRQSKDVEKTDKLKFYTECPSCGNNFIPPAPILTFINTVVNNANLKSDQSPCLELSKEIWNDPRLQGICPNCKEQLKFNPFFLDENELRALTSDDRFLMEQLWMKTSLRDAFHRNSPSSGN